MEEKMIVFFDGDCLLCQGALKWLNRLDSDDRLLFAPLQGATAMDLQIDQTVDSMAVMEGGEVWRSSEALRKACLKAGGSGSLIAGGLRVIPHWLREKGYQWVARNRKRLVKGTGCGLPEQGMREKMLP